MGNLYSVLKDLCDKRHITGYKMCKDCGMQPSIMTDLKMGRRTSVKAETANRLANYFGVSVDYLLGNETQEGPAQAPGHDILDDVDLAFFGEFRKLSEDDKDAVRDFVKVMQERRARKKQE